MAFFGWGEWEKLLLLFPIEGSNAIDTLRRLLHHGQDHRVKEFAIGLVGGVAAQAFPEEAGTFEEAQGSGIDGEDFALDAQEVGRGGEPVHGSGEELLANAVAAQVRMDGNANGGFVPELVTLRSMAAEHADNVPLLAGDPHVGIWLLSETGQDLPFFLHGREGIAYRPENIRRIGRVHFKEFQDFRRMFRIDEGNVHGGRLHRVNLGINEMDRPTQIESQSYMHHQKTNPSHSIALILPPRSAKSWLFDPTPVTSRQHLSPKNMIEKYSKVAVIGAGTMGNGIALVFAQSGYDVTLIDVSEAAL